MMKKNETYEIDTIERDDFSKKNSMELYLKEEYGIDNVLDYEFVDLRQNRDFEYDVSSVRGSVQLQLGKVRTYKQYMDRLNMVVKRLKKLKLL